MEITVLFTIKWMLLLLFSIIIAIYIGKGIGNMLKLNIDSFESMSFGFVMILAAIQCWGWMFVAFRWKMNIFIIFAIGIVLGLVILGIKYRSYSPIRRMDVHWISILMTIILIVATFLVYRSDADDAFYVSNATLFQNSTRINMYDSSFGKDSLGTVPMYDFQIWETLLAAVAKILSVEAVILMHTMIIPILLLFSASAYVFLGKCLLKDKLKSELFYLLISIFHLFGGYAVYSEGSFLLSRVWQGKAVYLTIVLPVLTGVILKLISEKNYMKTSFLVFACMLAGVALNPTSIYVLGFQVLFMLIAIAVYSRRIKVLCSCIPAVLVAGFFSLLIYLRTSKYNGQIEASSSAGEGFVKNVFTSFMGQGKMYFLLFIIAIVIILIYGNLESKLCFCLTPLLMEIGIWNPVMGKLVAEKLTKCPSYWRVFWLMPIGTALAYSIIIMFDKTKKNYRGIILIVGTLIMIVPGKWMFSQENGFIKANNVEKLPDEVVFFGTDYYGENKKCIVLGNDAFATTIRQKYVNCELIFSRGTYVMDLFYFRGEKEDADNRLKMANFANGVLEDYTNVNDLFEQYNVDYIILKSDDNKGNNYLINNYWNKEESTKNYVIYSAPH